jgi:antitoxin (DNA-binding transcriptional repressor) of toxin-antitoxin stability system
MFRRGLRGPISGRYGHGPAGDMVRRGSEVEILEREVPIARLVGLAGAAPGADKQRIERLAKAGILRRGPSAPGRRSRARRSPGLDVAERRSTLRRWGRGMVPSRRARSEVGETSLGQIRRTGRRKQRDLNEGQTRARRCVDAR